MTDERIGELERIGFVWRVRKIGQASQKPSSSSLKSAKAAKLKGKRPGPVTMSPGAREENGGELSKKD